MTYPIHRRALASIEISTIFVASFFPLNIVRTAVVRLFGGKVGKGVAIHHGAVIRSARRLRIGDDVWIGVGVSLDARGGLSIEASTSIGDGVQIWTAQHDWRSSDFAYQSRPSMIGHHVWINTRSILIPGIQVGSGAVVAAGAVVTKDVPPWSLAGGNPARIIASRPVVDEYRLNATSSKLYCW